MKQLTILSGKGGTGKTTITASFATLVKKAVIVDCDVDAPDLHILLNPEIIQMEEFKGSKIAYINETICIKCSLCKEKCRFDAISDSFKVNPFACEGCGVCTNVCPVKAITLLERNSGQVYISKTEYGFMTHAILSPGEANSGKLVTLVRNKARMVAEKEKSDFIIIDGSPGIGCPVIASITGVDVGLVVTEPSISGIHDLKRALKLLAHFNILPSVCINMYDINRVNTKRIMKFCEKMNIEVVGKVPFSTIVTEAMVNGKPVMEYAPNSNVAKELAKMWANMSSILKAER